MANPTSVSAQLMANPEFAPQVQGLERQRRMAEMLMTQGLQPQQGQMISGRYVAPAWTQQLAGLANIAAGNYLQEKADTKQQELAKALRAKEQEAVQNYFGALQGTPGVAAQEPVIPKGQTLYDNDGNLTYGAKEGVAAIPAKGPDYARAFQAATSEYAPQWLATHAVKSLEPVKLGEGEVLSQRNPFTGQTEVLGQGGEKKSNEMRNYEQARKDGFNGSFMDYEVFMANRKAPRISVGGVGAGVQQGQGGFDKKGNYIAPNGAVYSQTELRKDREDLKGLISGVQAINKINPADIKASDTILGNVTESPTKSWLAKQLLPGGGAVVAAQNKINAAGVMQALNNLPPGPASDKDIAMARSSFPGYGNAQALNEWVTNTSNMLNSKIANYEQKYGGMNWYGVTSPTTTINNAASGDGGFTIKPKGQ